MCQPLDVDFVHLHNLAYMDLYSLMRHMNDKTISFWQIGLFVFFLFTKWGFCDRMKEVMYLIAKEKLMRLDKFLSMTGKATRSEAGKAVRSGGVLVNGVPAKKADMDIDPDTDIVVYRGETVVYRTHTYVMLHKPDGVVSATEDGREQTVLDLLPPELRKLRPPLFPCGRLDKHTTGLMILTGNGQLAHRLLSPARHVDKTYVFRVKFPLWDEDIQALESGVDIGGYVTAPCTVTLDPPDTEGHQKSGRITLHEGKYHQIKLMMEARHNQITALHRITFGPLTLDERLAPGEWRLLTDSEVAMLERAGE